MIVKACSCGSGEAYAACCGPLHLGALPAPTALALMRSRYAAFALGDTGYLFRTWHPRTRPDDVGLDPALTWTGLEITEVMAGGAQDHEGEVAFVAHWRAPVAASGRASGGDGALTERSRFVRRAGRWLYLDGAHD